MPTLQTRKQRGSYATPPWLVDALVDAVVDQAVATLVPGTRVSVLDPACGDGRFLLAAALRLRAAGARPRLVGVDVDAGAIAVAGAVLAAEPDVELHHADALALDLDDGAFDVVVTNPPFLSQLSAATTRRGTSRHGGGPYADAAAEFLALAVRAARPGGGRVGLVLPQSVLASRDVAPLRAEVDRLATRVWSWWSPRPVFDDAQVVACALVFERRVPSAPDVHHPVADGDATWGSVITDALGVPDVPPLEVHGSVGERALLTANFRDQYYGLVPAVRDDGDDVDGPPLVTSGLVDPGRCHWGQRPVTFARRRYEAPRVDIGALAPWMRRWAADLLVPKVLVANQTRVVEAVADPDGAWLPGVPVLTARPTDPGEVWPLAAVLTSPVAAAWAWHRAAGTGLSAAALRLGPRWLGELPWPRGSVAPAVAALRDGDVAGCGRLVTAAYGLATTRKGPAGLLAWWAQNLPR